MNHEEAKRQVSSHIDSIEHQLWGISHSLYENPEIAFEEYQSSKLLADTLSQSGFDVRVNVGGLETAFRAVGNGDGEGPTIAFLAEYDALPEIGHACGHNLIAAAAVGAGIGILGVLDSFKGQIQVIGTPAEEGGGGKRILVEAGVFQDVDAAMMFHASSKNMVTRGSLASMRLNLEFFGKTAHAAATPFQGINALDAMLLTFTNINALRQQLEMSDRVAGVITHGGDVANVIPAYTAATFSVRGKTEDRREQVLKKVLACADAAAIATGCEMKYSESPGYAEIFPNPTLARLFIQNLESLGRQVVDPKPDEPMGSTDMGNVSRIIPSIHPYLEVVQPGVAGHTVEFRETCISETGKAAVMDAAKAMAMTAVDLLAEPSLLAQAKAELEAYLAGG